MKHRQHGESRGHKTTMEKAVDLLREPGSRRVALPEVDAALARIVALQERLCEGRRSASAL